MDWLNKLKKHDPLYAVYQRLYFSFKDTNRLEVNKWKKILHANRNQKRAEVTLLGKMPDKINFKSKTVMRQIRTLYINKTDIHKEDIKITTKYAPKKRALKCIKQILTEKKEEIHNSTIVAEDLNTHFQ